MQRLIDSCLEKELYTKEIHHNQAEADSISTVPLSSPEDFLFTIKNAPEEKKYFYSPPSNYLFESVNDSENYDLNNESEKEEEKDSENENEKKEEGDELFTCEVCQKTYLSESALYTHKKIKHNFVKERIPSNPGKKPRGRPRKEEVPIENTFYYDPKTMQYFLKSGRIGTVKNSEYSECINDAFEKLSKVEKNAKKIFEILGLKYSNINSHPFLGQFLNDSHDKYKIIMNLDEKMDIIFMNYLNRISLYCKPNYYSKVICFISLFRDFVYKKDDKNKVDDIPYFCNEFISSFFNDENFIELSANEAVELMINFCQWLYDNSYTAAKLSLN